MNESVLGRVPHFIFVAPAHTPPRASLCDAWRRAIARYFPDEARARALFTVVEGRLLEIEAGELRCDCIVSPANAFGIMDGGFDLELSRAFEGTSGDTYHLTGHVQRELGWRWGGFAPAGTCTLVALPGCCGGEKNRWGTEMVGVLPTMKGPECVGWQKELVYNGMWGLLCAIRVHNGAGGGHCIRTVLMTGLGTGAGGISAERCALQMVVAVKHYLEGLPASVRWESEQLQRRIHDIQQTMSA